MGQFAKTNAENLVRHSGSGIYYLSAKVLGKKIRRSLETDALRVALLRRDEMLRTLRESISTGRCKCLGDALAITLKRYQDEVSTKSSTRAYYGFVGASLKKLMPVTVRGWSADEQRNWWKLTIVGRSAAWVNNSLAVVKAVVNTARAEGMQVDVCPLRRVPMRRARESCLPSRADFSLVVKSIRSQGKGNSAEAGDMVEFLAWSGMRVAELRALVWALVWDDLGEEWLVIRGGPEGTKSKRVRRLPISAPLRAVVARRWYEGASGRVFGLSSPRESLKNACERLSVAHVRVHDLRHLFATRCIEAGVDVPTVAKWLGHSDGGVLAMKIYGHLRDDHSLSSAKLLFAGVAGAVEG